MKSSVRLLTISGIDIKAHVTFPLVLVWAALQFGVLFRRGLEGAVFGVIVTLILFAIVLLHELGHSAAARRYDIPIVQIILLPIGGVAQLGRYPDNPKEELVISAAGPFVNFVIALLMIAVALIAGLPLRLSELRIEALGGLGSLVFSTIFSFIFLSNLMVGLFNLLPAFPMDGGRILRAILALKMRYVRATLIAVGVAQILAVVLGIYGVRNFGLFAMIIAFFVFFGARQEGQIVRIRETLEKRKVSEVYRIPSTRLEPWMDLEQALSLMLPSLQMDFPVLENGKLVGMVERSKLLEVAHHQGTSGKVQDVMATGIPAVAPGDDLFQANLVIGENRQKAVSVEYEGVFLGILGPADIYPYYPSRSKAADQMKPATSN